MEDLLAGLRAIAETTRLRLLFALSHGEFNVSELTQILGQSQPRVSRHLKLMAEAGLLSRYKEGSWVLFRLREEAMGGALARATVDLLPAGDSLLASDLARLEEIRHQRAEAAATYFAENAENWEKLRSLHVREEDVEQAMLRIAGSQSVDTYLDLGTGTGRILRLFSPHARQSIGIDSSREMLAVARANLDSATLRRSQVRHADIYALPFSNGFADFVTIHQVLHYLDEPARALIEASRVMKPGGRLMIVDFAPHQLEELRERHAHRRLGVDPQLMSTWLQRSGFTLESHESLPPPQRGSETGLTVSIWLATRARGGAPSLKRRAAAASDAG